ncbi:unnamed protein product, partial [Protopolystoma xenopodis]
MSLLIKEPSSSFLVSSLSCPLNPAPQVCHKSYTQFSNLCRHKRLHKRCSQPLDCSACGHAFGTNYSLLRHQSLGLCLGHAVSTQHLPQPDPAHSSCFRSSSPAHYVAALPTSHEAGPVSLGLSRPNWAQESANPSQDCGIPLAEDPRLLPSQLLPSVKPETPSFGPARLNSAYHHGSVESSNLLIQTHDLRATKSAGALRTASLSNGRLHGQASTISSALRYAQHEGKIRTRLVRSLSWPYCSDAGASRSRGSWAISTCPITVRQTRSHSWPTRSVKENWATQAPGPSLNRESAKPVLAALDCQNPRRVHPQLYCSEADRLVSSCTVTSERTSCMRAQVSRDPKEPRLSRQTVDRRPTIALGSLLPSGAYDEDCELPEVLRENKHRQLQPSSWPLDVGLSEAKTNGFQGG